MSFHEKPTQSRWKIRAADKSTLSKRASLQFEDDDNRNSVRASSSSSASASSFSKSRFVMVVFVPTGLRLLLFHFECATTFSVGHHLVTRSDSIHPSIGRCNRRFADNHSILTTSLSCRIPKESSSIRTFPLYARGILQSEAGGRNQRGEITKSNKDVDHSKKRRKKSARNRSKASSSSSSSSSKTISGETHLQTWRVFGVEVHPDLLGSNDVINRSKGKTHGNIPGVTTTTTTTTTTTPVDKLYLCQPVIDSLLSRLKLTKKSDDISLLKHLKHDDKANTLVGANVILPNEIINVCVVRRSLDARKKRRHGNKTVDGSDGPRYTYVLDVDVSNAVSEKLRFKHQPGRMELLSEQPLQTSSASTRTNEDVSVMHHSVGQQTETDLPLSHHKPRVIIVGAGPAGLFCALTLARSGMCSPILLERGQPVESRGRDIGALIHRRSIDSESNFAFGEGGAGTWSDGKLTTRIGRNSDAVRFVLETFVKYGAPEKILIDGAPHLGTDNLVRLLRNMRQDLRDAGGEIRFGAKMTKIHRKDGTVTGVDVIYSGAAERGARDGGKSSSSEGTETITGDVVVLATGHSARDVYEELHAAGVQLEPKGFAAGFRVEHPQRIINQIQYGREWGPNVITGKGATDAANQEYFETGRDQSGTTADSPSSPRQSHSGRLPVASYRLATDKAFDGTSTRGVYSFCMCPGGQIVPASTDPNEVCVNGMSFSNRDSVWANSALVVAISPDDPVLDKYRDDYGVLAGVAFQRDMERRASALGGGNLTVPVQRLTDFVEGRPSTTAPASSYRLGVKPAACHTIYPAPLVTALRDSVVNYFEKQMPGFLCEEALLHAVETRTSSPVRVSRDSDTLQAIGVRRLFPAGEGAGFAGGIVSAAVDGMMVAEAVLEELVGHKVDTRVRTSRTRSVGFDY